MTPRCSRLMRALATSLLSLLATTVGASPTLAANGNYTQVVCANPDTGMGVGAADGIVPSGFTSNIRRTLGPAPSDSKCGPGLMNGGRGVLLRVGVPFSTNISWEGSSALTFTTPSGLSLQRVELFRAGDTRSWGNHMSFAIHSDAWDYIYGEPAAERCDWASCWSRGNPSDPWAPENRVGFANPLSTGVSVTLSCALPDTTWTCNVASDIYVRVFGGKLTLRDETNPQISGAASGPLMTEPVVRGEQDLTVNATDTGSGLYRVQLLVDNAPAMSHIIDGNAGKCSDVNPANADPHEFAHPVPCRLSAGGTYGFDTRQLPEGTHNLKILLEDAAGNSATLSNRNVVVDNVPDPAAPGHGNDGATAAGNASSTTTVFNTTTSTTSASTSAIDRGAPNGRNATDDARLTAWWASNRGSLLRSRYGVRHVIRGRLTDRAGKSIGNARIELAATQSAKGARESLDKGGARTRPDGTWTLILPVDVSSRLLRFRYRSHANDTTPAATRTLRLRVRAGVRLSVTPQVAKRGKTIRLAGRLLGRPVPRVGKVLELQARTPGTAWVTFSTVRTRPGGAFTSKYTFRRGGPVTYELRVRSRASDDYPFDLGVSRAVRVRVR
jgi:hypothetical protein